MPALTRNRRFVRSVISGERAGIPARGGLHTNRRGMRGGVRAFLPDLGPLRHYTQGAVCRKGPRGSRRAGLLRKEHPMGSDFRARRGLRALAVTGVVSLALIATPARTAQAASPTNVQRAQQGAQWLANQIKRGGGVLQDFGKADPVDTAYAVIGMRATGVDRAASKEAIAALKTKIGSDLETGGHASPGALAEYIMAAVSDGQDPRHFGGVGPSNNLVDRLLATARTSGTDKGLFGASDPTFDGAYRQGLALEALKVANVSSSDPRVSAAIAWLTKQQCANGLWEAYRAQVGTPCPPANPKTFTGPDTNSTSSAVQGLAAWGKFPPRARCSVH